MSFELGRRKMVMKVKKISGMILALWFEALDEYIIRRGSGLIGNLTRINR